jgi:hypothetical protein
MKAMAAFLLFSLSAIAQMTPAALLKLDREFAQATSEKASRWVDDVHDGNNSNLRPP